MKLLAPSLLSADFSNLKEQIKLTEAGGADIIHCDIMDGRFVPNITFGPLVVEAIRNSTNLPLDVHLMIEDPDRYLKNFVDAGADYISVHQETLIHLHRSIYSIKEFGVKAGVAINPATPIDLLSEIITDVDFIMIMSVNPGFGGQFFLSNSLNKIKALHNIRAKKDLNFKIEIDGGIDLNTIGRVADTGCDIFVAGSAIFSSKDIKNTTSEFKKVLSQY
jgi:ribulose-phosphate 3-epimerase